MGRSDTVLTQNIKQGDQKAFEDIYTRYHKQLFFLAKKYLKDQDLAEDAVQDIFVKLWEKRRSLDASQSVKAFLFTMLKNHLLNMVRNRKKTILSGYEKKEEIQAGRNQTDDDMLYTEYENHVKSGLAELSEGRKAIFELKVYKGLSNEQVADQLLVSIHTVKSQFYHGSKHIRTYLKKNADIHS
ncbi:MAG: RNA polymerase sigma-70 factor [Balneolales bacterium]